MAAIQSRFEVAVPELPDHIDPASYSKLSIDSVCDVVLMVFHSDIVVMSKISFFCVSVVLFISTQSRDGLIFDFRKLKLALKHISNTVYFPSFIIIFLLDARIT